ncbi:hypothetical protein L1887_42669 [Cichorium endivia]|nr:hypothetical protein L1887_42669 [Cichorium endivia]
MELRILDRLNLPVAVHAGGSAGTCPAAADRPHGRSLPVVESALSSRARAAEWPLPDSGAQSRRSRSARSRYDRYRGRRHSLSPPTRRARRGPPDEQFADYP